MKTLVISAIIAMTSLVNVVSAAAVNRTDNFAYNTETNDGRVETQTVFKVENQKFLHRHLKYNYIYDKLRSHLPKRSAEMERIHAKL